MSFGDHVLFSHVALALAYRYRMSWQQAWAGQQCKLLRTPADGDQRGPKRPTVYDHDGIR